MEFSPFNPIVKLCLQGMEMEENGKPEEARRLFTQSWDEATNDFEKFLAAHYVARHQHNVADRLKWLETGLHFALKVNSPAADSALPSLYLTISRCYEELGDAEKAKSYSGLANLSANNLTDNGPFYHGTKADLQTGDVLTAGGGSNYKAELKMNHIYFTALVDGAALAAALAKGDGNERVYIVEPTGNFENDPNLTDRKFPGNPSRSYRSEAPLKIVGEVKGWAAQTPQAIQKFREKLENNRGEIIN
ncbi:rifampin ADP-ribosyl transferase [Flavobacteriaceae bacterium 3519-10]|nr:rifampin ADP-ribosyl transferase [Flavobacteriaceae bacterium 3519-10]